MFSSGPFVLISANVLFVRKAKIYDIKHKTRSVEPPLTGTNIMSNDKISAFWASHVESLHNCSTVAAVLGDTVAKLERDAWLGQGLPLVRVGRAVRYRKRSVEAFIAANEETYAEVS